jgi:tetrapyrrole methylase family protein/MazG family protein
MRDLKARVLDERLSPFERLVKLIDVLRSPEGCNWDRAQTHQSLVPYLIEETYEVVDTIESGRIDELREELGDLLVQVVFHAQLAKERNEFSVNDAISDVVAKLIRRHPHVFGEKKDLDPQQVRDQWERIKTQSGEKKSVLSGLPRSMPALTMAYRIGEKAGGAGFDWAKPQDVLEKIDEETREVRQAMQSGSTDHKELLTDELGDLLFATASLARKLHIDPEYALKKSLEKFRMRFDELERQVSESGAKFSDHTVESLEELWQAIKRDRGKHEGA